ncbi:MAG: VOC family protein [Pseudomonadota bacterium]
MSCDLAPPAQLRTLFASAMSELYSAEVPSYADLVNLVETTNAQILRERRDPRSENHVCVAEISSQRHGAIRVGRPDELSFLRRLFALFGMQPVAFYDLVPAGLPVYSTAFRPISASELVSSPFRMFCSLLRPELIQDPTVRDQVIASISERKIATPRLERLLEQAEARGGVRSEDAAELIDESVRVFLWTGEARVSKSLYESFLSSHRLIADIAAFAGPHINHLTPNTLDIDRLQAGLVDAGLKAKATIEGPPRRECPVLLRQTAFHAVEETVRFATNNHEDNAEDVIGKHTARFGEVEQRGAALTPMGRELYDTCLTQAHGGVQDSDQEQRLRDAFETFPDDWQTLLERDLVYFRYALVEGKNHGRMSDLDLGNPTARADAVTHGLLSVEPILYEDFLPVSAAGIFRSNLGTDTSEGPSGASPNHSSQTDFESALGRPVIDPHILYAAEQKKTLDDVAEQLINLCGQ